MFGLYEKISLRGNRILCSGLCGAFALSVSLGAHFQPVSLPDRVPGVTKAIELEPLGLRLGRLGEEQGKGFAKQGIGEVVARDMIEAMIVVPPAKQKRMPFEELFGTRSVSVGNTLIAQRWNSVLAEAGDTEILSSCSTRDEAFCASPRVVAMRNEVSRLRDRPLELQVRAVNEFVNRHIRYASDIAVYGRPDHWASLRETLTNGGGDCEDFAIAKMWMLRALGVPLEALRLVVLRDNATRQDHAVLAVHHEGGSWVLDNRFAVVRSDDQIRHYQPYYSLSASGSSWVHSIPVAAEKPVAAASLGRVVSQRIN